MIAILLIVVFLFYFTIHTYQKQTARQAIAEKRIQSTNEFIENMERDVSRGVYITSYRSLLAIEEYMGENGAFVDDIDGLFYEAFANGTVNQSTRAMLAGSTFNDWIVRIENQADQLNIDVNLTLRNVTISQNDTWHVLVQTDLTYAVADKTGLSRWDRNATLIVPVSIVGLEDPLYIVYGLGRMTNTIKHGEFDGNFTFQNSGTWNVSNLLNHTYSGAYVDHADAPSFLMRFENDLGSSPYGVESLLDLKKMGDLGLFPDTSNSIVDYVHWSNITTTNYRVNFTPTWFHLDDEHLDRYDTSAISYLG